MNKNFFLAFLVSFLLVVSLLGFYLTLDTQLFAPDGQNHYDFVQFDNCDSGYPNGICWMTNWMNLTPFNFWLIFFVISMLIPISFVLYTKNLWLFPAFFVFTGFFWQSMAMQVFAQIIVSLIFIFFIFEENSDKRLGMLGLLWVILLLGIELHNTMFFVLIGITVYEVLALINEVVEEIPFRVVGCGVLPAQGVAKVAESTGKIRTAMNNKIGTLIDNLIYYGYSFFVENMFIGFVIPGIYEIFSSVDFRKIYYFLFVVIGALFSWWYLDWQIWYVTRILLWLPLVLFVPFMDWLQRQTHLTKTIFIFIGLCYFFFNIWYFINRVQNIGCV